MRRESWLIGCAPAIGALVLLIAAGPHAFYGHSDSDLFLAVARSPFGAGRHFPGDPGAQGVAYRYGRIFLPVLGWLFGAGRKAWITWSLAVVCAVSIGLWVATTAEHLARAGRDPKLALLVLVLPYMLVWLSLPVVFAEPLAASLVLLAYLLDADRRGGWAIATAALAILTRETLVIAFIPLAWRAARERGIANAGRWLVALVPYAMWAAWVRLRIGQFPFLDHATTRRFALAPPFVGWGQVFDHPPYEGAAYGIVVATLTLAVAAAVAWRRRPWPSLMQAALWTCAFIACLGWAVWQYPSEALRVMAPAQGLLLLAALTQHDRRAQDILVSPPAPSGAP